MNRPRFLLLNPPGKARYLRDYYCSSIAKADYYWHPGDLLIQSGILDTRFEVRILDACAAGMSFNDALTAARDFAPDYLFFLAGAGSWQSDFDFAGKVGVGKVFGSGEIFMDDGAPYFERYPFLTGVLLDFTTPDLIRYLDGDFDAIEAMEYRRDGKLIRRFTRGSGEFEIPVPLHESFGEHYRMPFSRHRRFASVLTDFGCAHRCTFCNSWTVGHKTRPIENLLPELVHVQRMGIGQIFIKDMSFGADREHAFVVCDALSKFDFDWHCYARADDLDRELVSAMNDSGCYMVQMGMEHVDAGVLALANKAVPYQRVRSSVELCQSMSMRVGLHLVLGLPGESAASLAALDRAVLSLNADYLSVNLAAPRFGTPYRRQLQKGGAFLAEFHDGTTGLGTADGAVPLSVLQAARRRIISRFYLRPAYLLGQLKKAGNTRAFGRGILSAFSLLKNLLFPSRSDAVR